MKKRNKLLKLLQRFKYLLNGTLVTWKTYPEYFDIKEDVNSICSQPY